MKQGCHTSLQTAKHLLAVVSLVLLVLEEVLVHLWCVVVGIMEGGLDVLPPAGALVLYIQVDGGVHTTQAVQQVVTRDLLKHRVGGTCSSRVENGKLCARALV